MRLRVRRARGAAGPSMLTSQSASLSLPPPLAAAADAAVGCFDRFRRRLLCSCNRARQLLREVGRAKIRVELRVGMRVGISIGLEGENKVKVLGEGSDQHRAILCLAISNAVPTPVAQHEQPTMRPVSRRLRSTTVVV